MSQMNTTIFHDHSIIDAMTYKRNMKTVGLLGEPTVFDSEGLTTHHVEFVKKYVSAYEDYSRINTHQNRDEISIDMNDVKSDDIIKFQNSTHIISASDGSSPPYNYKFETDAIRWDSSIIYSISERGIFSLILRGNINSSYPHELENVKLVDINNQEYTIDLPIKIGKTTITLLTVQEIPYKLFHMISLRNGVIKARRRIIFQTPIDIPPSTHNFMISKVNVDSVETNSTGKVIPKSYHLGDTLDYLLDYTSETIAHVLLSRPNSGQLKISVKVVKRDHVDVPIMFYHKCRGTKIPKLVSFSGGKHLMFWDERKTTICFVVIGVDSFVINLEIMS